MKVTVDQGEKLREKQSLWNVKSVQHREVVLSPGMLSNHLILCRPLLLPSGEKGCKSAVPKRATVERQFTQRAHKGDRRVGTLTYRQYSAGRERGLLVNGISDALYIPGLQNYCRR